jgi:prolyl oligopeptidase
VTDQDDNVLVYERPDRPDWRFAAEVTDDGRYLIITVREGTDRRNRVYYMDWKTRRPRTERPGGGTAG